jgi:hypothetical protein
VWNGWCLTVGDCALCRLGLIIALEFGTAQGPYYVLLPQRSESGGFVGVEIRSSDICTGTKYSQHLSA